MGSYPTWSRSGRPMGWGYLAKNAYGLREYPQLYQGFATPGQYHHIAETCHSTNPREGVRSTFKCGKESGSVGERPHDSLSRATTSLALTKTRSRLVSHP